MTQWAATYFDYSYTLLGHFFLVFLRVGALVALLPAVGEQSVPARIKLAVSCAFVLITAPAVPLPDVATVTDLIGRLMVVEILVGLGLGVSLRLFVLALQTAGSIAANATSLSQILGGAGADPLPAIGYVLVISGLALAVMAGLHIRAAEFLVRSYDVFPMGVFPTAQTFSSWGVAGIARAFSLAFVLSAPFLIVSVIYNLTLGVINKAMPQLMVAFVGAPVITLGAVALLLLVSPVLLSVWVAALNGFMDSPFGPLP